MFRHHPAFAETGELEIAQRAALHVASVAGGPTVNVDDTALRDAISAYLAEMRRAWKPEAIEISEGDHIVIALNGQRAEIEHDTISGRPAIAVFSGSGREELATWHKL